MIFQKYTHVNNVGCIKAYTLIKKGTSHCHLICVCLSWQCLLAFLLYVIQVLNAEIHKFPKGLEENWSGRIFCHCWFGALFCLQHSYNGKRQYHSFT